MLTWAEDSTGKERVRGKGVGRNGELKAYFPSTCTYEGAKRLYVPV